MSGIAEGASAKVCLRQSHKADMVHRRPEGWVQCARHWEIRRRSLVTDREYFWKQPTSPDFSSRPWFPGRYLKLHRKGLWGFPVWFSLCVSSYPIRILGPEAPWLSDMPNSSNHLGSEISKISAWWQTIKLGTLHYSRQHSGWGRQEPLVDCGERWLVTVGREQTLGKPGNLQCVGVFWWKGLYEQSLGQLWMWLSFPSKHTSRDRSLLLCPLRTRRHLPGTLSPHPPFFSLSTVTISPGFTRITFTSGVLCHCRTWVLRSVVWKYLL